MSTAIASGSLAALAACGSLMMDAPPRAFHIAVMSLAVRLEKSTLKPSSTQIDCCSRPATRSPKAMSSRPSNRARSFHPGLRARATTVEPNSRSLMPLELVAGALRVAAEHGYRLARVLGQVLANERQLGQQIGGEGDDVAAGLIRLDDVEQLARAGPQQLSLRMRAQQRHCLADHRHWIAPRVGHAPGEQRDDGRYPVVDCFRHLLDLRERQQCSDVDLHARAGEPPDELVCALAARVRARNLDVDVRPPAGDLARLPLHLTRLVGDHLERHRDVAHALEKPAT